ncbi:hypothetical protein G9A89_017574 [Geosiphon pyriformis]|nr:hypothetical protein G9A89_017574 [Geosiphon pyriformis]
MEFKIGDQILLHYTKTEKQWSGKFDPKWDSPFHIHEALENRAYKLQLEDKILKKVAHGNRPEDIPRDLEPIIVIKTRYLVPELEKIKEALARGTKLSKTGEWTPDNVQKWKERLPPAYWFYKIGEQLDLKTPYKDLSQKTFNKEAIQQQHTDYTPSSNIAQIIEQITNQQFKDLQKAILEATIEHYTNKATITDIYSFAGAQF